MRVLLMHPDRDFDVEQRLPANEGELVQDLELEVLFGAMAGGDGFVGKVARVALLGGAGAIEAIEYRQAVLDDCLKHPDVIRELYALAVETIQSERRQWGLFHASSQSVLSRSLRVMDIFLDSLKRLRQIGDDNASTFSSHGFRQLFAMLDDELSDEYFALVEDRIADLRFKQGTLTSAHLGVGVRGVGYVLREFEQRSWMQRLTPFGKSGHSFEIAARDEAGARAVAQLADRGINLAANALAQSVEHILSFFRLLLTELAFYVGCINLQELLEAKGEPRCVPVARPAHGHALGAQGIYDVCLSLKLGEGASAIGNDIEADGASLIVITGANRGGKSTFLRSLGLAQLMMQAGMLVGAESFTANLREGVFTHYKREEDDTMSSGKLVEELDRMSALVDLMSTDSLLLSNESFASTNEREASEISRQVIAALTEAGIKVVFVTHLYDLGHHLYESTSDDRVFLRAEPDHDGVPTYKLTVGEPLPTSHGVDIYKRVFGSTPEGAAISDSGSDAARAESGSISPE